MLNPKSWNLKTWHHIQIQWPQKPLDTNFWHQNIFRILIRHIHSTILIFEKLKSFESIDVENLSTKIFIQFENVKHFRNENSFFIALRRRSFFKTIFSTEWGKIFKIYFWFIIFFMNNWRTKFSRKIQNFFSKNTHTIIKSILYKNFREFSRCIFGTALLRSQNQLLFFYQKRIYIFLHQWILLYI